MKTSNHHATGPHSRQGRLKLRRTKALEQVTMRVIREGFYPTSDGRNDWLNTDEGEATRVKRLARAQRELAVLSDLLR